MRLNPIIMFMPLMVVLIVILANAHVSVSLTCDPGQHLVRHNIKGGYTLDCVKNPPPPKPTINLRSSPWNGQSKF